MAKEHKKTGRPLIEINEKEVYNLASVGCKNTEIAVILGCSVDTLDRRFADQLRKGRENLKVSLRRWQLEAARKGNPSLLIWLGKQYLGQVDNVHNDEEFELDTEVKKYEAP